MRQAENLRGFAHPLLLPGIKLTTGPTDHYPVEQVQLQRFDGQAWVRFGEVMASSTCCSWRKTGPPAASSRAARRSAAVSNPFGGVDPGVFHNLLFNTINQIQAGRARR
jgi:hypothetical protein